METTTFEVWLASLPAAADDRVPLLKQWMQAAKPFMRELLNGPITTLGYPEAEARDIDGHRLAPAAVHPAIRVHRFFRKN
eukprot:jgi/Tetstr1/431212/TSEL_020924.t1